MLESAYWFCSVSEERYLRIWSNYVWRACACPQILSSAFSLSRTSLSLIGSWPFFPWGMTFSANFLLISRQNINLSELSRVARWDAARKLPTVVWASCLKAFPSILAILAHLLIVCIKRLTSPLASAHPVMTFRFLNPCCWVYFANLELLKGALLSVFTSFGIPYVLKTWIKWGMTASAEVFEANFTRGSLLGKGPAKSPLTFSHGPFGKIDIRRSSLVWQGVVAWQARHFPTCFSTTLYTIGNQTWARSNCLVRPMPWCPSCPILIIVSLSSRVTTILSPRRTSPSTTDNSSKTQV